MITSRHATLPLAILLLLSGCGLKAPLVLPPRTALPPAPRSVPAVAAPTPVDPAAGQSGCPADRPGSGDETECAAKPGTP